MGYTTNFKGQFALNKPLAPEHAEYLRAFNETRRMRRDPVKAEALPDPKRIAAGLPIGKDGAYFVGGLGFMGQERDASITKDAAPPGQPGLWCQWIPSEDGAAIEWDGGEKFYKYVEWLQYLMDHFLTPWGYALTGSVSFQGERSDDRGEVAIRDDMAVKVVKETDAWETVAAVDKEWFAEQLQEVSDNADRDRRHVVDSAMAALGLG